MDLKIKKWDKIHIKEFEVYLESIKGSEKEIEFERSIVNTQLPCLGIKAPVIEKIVKEMLKGNYISYLDLFLLNNHTEVIIFAKLLSKVEDFDLFASYLYDFAHNIDNWAGCDTIQFRIDEGNEEKLFNLAVEYTKDTNIFARRIGFRIFFKYIDNEDYLDKIFDIVAQSSAEENYYVNMCISWLMCESFIKQREKTLKFIKKSKLNKFVINKTISKCRDSFRVSSQDKEMLLQFRKK